MKRKKISYTNSWTKRGFCVDEGGNDYSEFIQTLLAALPLNQKQLALF